MDKPVKNNGGEIKPAKIGEIIEGKIIGSGRSSLYLDLGAIGTGIIYGREFYAAKSHLRNLDIGDTIFAKIVDLENEDGYIELSISDASKEMTWKKIYEAKNKGEKFPVKITGANKGGLIAEVFGIQAFLPVSQLEEEHYPRVDGGDSSKILQELQQFMGQELEVKIFDMDPKTDKLILSEKAKETEKLKEILDNYKVGDIVDGEVTGITDFGVFMKFVAKSKAGEEETLEGLIHISELDWQLIENPAEIVKVGEKIKAQIIEIADTKVSLSLKALKQDPWTGAEEKYKKDDIIDGTVTKINPFGAFIQITDQIQGLCHISEFETRENMESKLEVGKKYKFQILTIDQKEHRMSLKLVEK